MTGISSSNDAFFLRRDEVYAESSRKILKSQDVQVKMDRNKKWIGMTFSCIDTGKAGLTGLVRCRIALEMHSGRE